MKRHSLTYIGELPPPYGGVAVKNQLVFQQLSDGRDARFIDLVDCKRAPWKIPYIFAKVVMSMITDKAIIIGVGTTRRRKVLLQMQRCLTGKKGMQKVMLMVMGGQLHRQVEEDRHLCRLLQNVGSMWVETEEMRGVLRAMGLENICFFPNCRENMNSRPPRIREKNSPLKLVFFSRICEEKGVDIIMKAYELLRMRKAPIALDFYGEIVDSIHGRFDAFIAGGGSDVYYHGVFDAVNKDVYGELNQYDILLLPTRWQGEGVPGAVVESKMAGITAIVSDWHANREVVRDGEEGVVLSDPTAERLASMILSLCGHPDKVQQLKEGAYASRLRYCVETYRHSLIDHIPG